MRKLFYLLTGLAFICLAGFLILNFVIPPHELLFENAKTGAASASAAIRSDDNFQTETIRLMAVGDIMLDRGVEYRITKEGQGDFKYPFLKISGYLKTADILFGNLESVISDKGTKVGSEYSFRANPKAIDGLVFAGFKILSIANNHAFDYGRGALEDNLKRLKKAGIEYVGAGLNETEAFLLKIIEIKNTKIGFLGYSAIGPDTWRAQDNQTGLALVGANDLEQIKSATEKAKRNVDILIVSFHWGDEYIATPNQFQTNWGETLIDAGADLVVGHHPHVVQPVERYNKGLIAYSLGNFVFDQGFSPETMKGLLLEVIIENKIIKEINEKDIKISDSFQPALGID